MVPEIIHQSLKKYAILIKFKVVFMSDDQYQLESFKVLNISILSKTSNATVLVFFISFVLKYVCREEHSANKLYVCKYIYIIVFYSLISLY